ncbi:MAG: hypothetical protein WA792_12775 [Pseudolabrys sp.]|jgi:hypothetical protein
MLKPVFIALAALVVAGTVALMSGPQVKEAVVSPAKASISEPASQCAKREWPYLHCVGTPAGNLRIRLITTDHINR